ncbi:hypothetical protein HF1_01410 [Mycoplasma haemofelis str. Langford 1]|uniref:Uncharacterized protein n=1 Tax=Mycoplasma haemofelis (strain Langford 1) TaxID=941640 RepID=E8ZKI3_MYCHL|nr:hypothetical protein HF1_01410 [Mycoplasma haemofelis str. Langford 1]
MFIGFGLAKLAIFGGLTAGGAGFGALGAYVWSSIRGNSTSDISSRL